MLRAREFKPNWEFDLWRYVDPQNVYSARGEAVLAAWRECLRVLIEKSNAPLTVKQDSLHSLRHIGLTNVFSLANILVRRGHLDKDEVTAAAVLLFT